MRVPTIYVSRMEVAATPDMVVLSLGEPSGALDGGKVVSEEAMRLVLSHRTLRLIAATLQKQVAELDRLAEAAAGRRPAAVELRAVSNDDDATSESQTLQ